MKKISLFLLILTCFITGVLGGACSGSSPEITVEKTFSVSHNDATLEVGQTLQLVAVCGMETIYFSCQDDAITVSETGLITAKKEGVATVVITAGEQKRSCVVTVICPDYSVEITVSSKTVMVNANLILNASVLRDGQDFNGVVVWSVNKDTGYSITRNGNKAIFVPTVKGEYVITATYDNNQSDSITITVIESASDLA